MNKKQIDSTAIENELKGASAFFPTTEKAESRTEPNDDILGKKVEDSMQGTLSPDKSADSGARKPQKRLLLQETIEEEHTFKETNAKNSQLPEDADTTTPSNHDTIVSRHHDTVVPSMVESIRKAVKLVGKEAATHRFTPEEKQAIADIIYASRRQGFDTSENEIARIAINWLVWDHQKNRDTSVLAQVLNALKE